jgi:hypothetical protein
MDLTTVYCNLDDFYRNFNVEMPTICFLGLVIFANVAQASARVSS